MQAAILEYFAGERLGGLTLVLVGVAGLGVSGWLWQARWELRALAIAVGVMALLELVVGVGLLLRTGPQVAALLGRLGSDPAGMIADEAARMDRVQRTFTVLQYTWLALIVGAAAAAIGLRGRPAIWGASLGVLLQASFMFVFDQVAERRGAVYLRALSQGTGGIAAPGAPPEAAR